MNRNPIGIFDSGIGGLSVVREIKKLLPNESIIYLADKENFPYGEKTPAQIRKISKKNVDRLLAHKVKLVVIACNTATVHAISYLRQQYPFVSFVGMEPAVKPASIVCKKGIIILSSPKAKVSKQLGSLIKKHAGNIKIFNIASLELVRAVEEKWSQVRIKKILSSILPRKILKQADVIVLGCTHFALIKNQIQKHVGKNIKVIDSGLAVARQVQKLLKEEILLI